MPPLVQRSEQIVYPTSAHMFYDLGLPNGIGLWLIVLQPLLVSDRTSQATQLFVNPLNLGSQTLRLQRGAEPFAETFK